jgi:deazaflavin-dependent oxidoreductase (nitroreductase family)
MPDPNDWNANIIEEFRANAGKVSSFAGADMLLLHHTGARTGTERVNPLVYLPQGDDFVVMASKGGAPDNPDWFHNLKANPDATVELGTGTVSVRAREAQGEERERLWETVKARYQGFGEYEQKTDRVIPVVVLERVS